MSPNFGHLGEVLDVGCPSELVLHLADELNHTQVVSGLPGLATILSRLRARTHPLHALQLREIIAVESGNVRSSLWKRRKWRSTLLEIVIDQFELKNDALRTQDGIRAMNRAKSSPRPADWVRVSWSGVGRELEGVGGG